MFGQEVRFPSAIVSAGGNSGQSTTVNLSRWRLNPVHIVTFPDAKFKEKDLVCEADWSVTIYPNPVEDYLYLEFELPEQREFVLKITDMAGRILFIQEPRPFINGSTVEINLLGYIPALYLLQVSSSDLKTQKVLRFQKL